MQAESGWNDIHHAPKSIYPLSITSQIPKQNPRSSSMYMENGGFVYTEIAGLPLHSQYQDINPDLLFYTTKDYILRHTI
jgi:hypothetical protein